MQNYRVMVRVPLDILDPSGRLVVAAGEMVREDPRLLELRRLMHRQPIQEAPDWLKQAVATLDIWKRPEAENAAQPEPVRGGEPSGGPMGLGQGYSTGYGRRHGKGKRARSGAHRHCPKCGGWLTAEGACNKCGGAR